MNSRVFIVIIIFFFLFVLAVFGSSVAVDPDMH